MPCQCSSDKQRARCIWWIDGEGLPPEVNTVTGEVRPTRGCFPEVALRWLVDVSKTNRSAAAAVETNRNEVAAGLGRVAAAIVSRVHAPALLEGERQP